jgi:hypothetical protein
MARLLPCTGCQRHVRAAEATCPFCGVEIVARSAAKPASLSRNAKLTRAAIVFTAGAAIAACGGKESDPPGNSSGASSSGTSGGSSGGSSGSSSGSSGSVDGGSPLPMYGPAVIDSGNDAPSDAKEEDSGFAVLYGPAPVDGGH